MGGPDQDALDERIRLASESSTTRNEIAKGDAEHCLDE
jgi:hypothetical protein